MWHDLYTCKCNGCVLNPSADVHPEELFLSTRRPETLSALQAKGAHCGFDNVKVCAKINFL